MGESNEEKAVETRYEQGGLKILYESDAALYTIVVGEREFRFDEDAFTDILDSPEDMIPHIKKVHTEIPDAMIQAKIPLESLVTALTTVKKAEDAALEEWGRKLPRA